MTDVPTGNTTDKYGTSNPIQRRLVDSFIATMFEIFDGVAPSSVLDVGCGEGVLTERMADRVNGGRVIGIDLDDPELQAEWAQRGRPNLSYQAVPAEALPFADREFELTCALEVLEHVEDPERVLGEMRRVTGGALLVSVPREPLWRALNMARGAYLRDLGNTPGHLNHWSKRSFLSMLERFGSVEQVRSPLPWTIALVRV